MFTVPLKIKISLLILLLISVASLLAYSNSLNNNFIWDDQALVLSNPLIGDFGFWKKAFSNNLYLGSVAGSNFYRPIQTLSYMWDYHFWQFRPLGYHITNIILHILVSFLVFIFLYDFSGSILISCLSALLFTVCPLYTESVSYISGRADLLLAVFLISSLLFFKKAHSSGGLSRAFFLSLSSLLFLCGLLSKELAAVFPLVILAFLFYYARPGNNKIRYAFWISMPFLAIDAVYLLLRATIFKFPTLRPAELAQFSLISRITVLSNAILTYFRLLFLPVNLHMSRTLGLPSSFIQISLSLFLLFALCLACFLAFKKGTRNSSFMLFWSLAFILPQSGIFAINAAFAEHFIYLASISFFYALVYWLSRILRKEILLLAIFGLGIFYGIATYGRNLEWGDGLIFFKRIVKFSPDSFQAQNNLGLQYEHRGEFDKAEAHYKKALAIKPGLLEAHSNLANLYFKTERFQEAKKEYETVKKIAPYFKAAEVEANIGLLYEAQGLLDEALNKYELALRLESSFNSIRFNIAHIYFAKGELDKAAGSIKDSLFKRVSGADECGECLKIIREYLRAAKSLSPAVTFYNDLGIKLAGKGFFDLAASAFIMALSFDPGYADAHFNLGLAYLKDGLNKQARAEFKRTLKINPGHYQAKGLLGEMKKKGFSLTSGAADGIN